MSSTRIDGRSHNSLRPLKLRSGVSPYAEGSTEVCFGNTTVLITASVEREVPRWMGDDAGGWITAEYGMLPRATHTRSRREASAGKQGGRTLEIQRLIGRALRQSVDLRDIDGLTIKLDCDVLIADGGTRTAAISGGWVALAGAIEWAKSEKLVPSDVMLRQIAAVSVGMRKGELLLDLCYEEDSSADFDLNLVFNDALEIIEIQGTAERAALDTERLLTLLELGKKGAKEILEAQRNVSFS